MSKFEFKKRDTASNQLLEYAKKHFDDDHSTTTGSGNPVGDKDASLTVGHQGPTLLQDIDLIDELSHFTHERIPERVVHANGAGAFGYFEVTHDITQYTAASVFAEVGKRTPIAIRFSTVFGERGYADTVTDIRGFAMKFYTDDGIWDLVGNNTPIFFINDAILFPSLIHILKRNPKTHLRDPDMFWDMLSLRPETTHQTVLMFSDRGIPASYRHMHGYGSHTYAFVNKFGKFFYCKFHMKTNQGIRNLAPELAAKIAGQDPDYHLRDLYNAIESKDFPSWDFYVQIMTPEQAAESHFNPFDMTKVWYHADFPLIPVGRFVLNRVPKNYFAEVEQLAFDPANLIPGIEPSPDRMLQGRLFAYRNTQMYRLGTNYRQIPVNRPFKVHNYSRDGAHNIDNQGDAPNYYPNSFHGPENDKRADALSPVLHVDAHVKRTDNNSEDNFTQSRVFYQRVLKPDERERLVRNIVESLRLANGVIQDRAIQNFSKVDPDFGNRIRRGIKAQTHAEI